MGDTLREVLRGRTPHIAEMMTCLRVLAISDDEMAARFGRAGDTRALHPGTDPSDSRCRLGVRMLTAGSWRQERAPWEGMVPTERPLDAGAVASGSVGS